jgi:hypothetical protein
VRLPPERVTVLFAARVVKLPLPGVVTPIAVLLIPVLVVVILPDVISKLFAPVLIVDSLSPDKLIVPLVLVRLIAPVVRVSPFAATNVPLDVVVPLITMSPTDPPSVRVRRVLGDASLSVMLKTPFVPRVASLIVSVAPLKISGVVEERVIVWFVEAPRAVIEASVSASVPVIVMVLVPESVLIEFIPAPASVTLPLSPLMVAPPPDAFVHSGMPEALTEST